MSDPFVGEIRMFAGNFAPRGNAFCDGQLVAVSQNDALFSLLGTIYGGDGRTTFGLPDLRGRVPVHEGSGPGLTVRRLGSKAGQEKVTVTVNELPAHTHAMKGSAEAANSANPAGNMVAQTSTFDLYRSGGPTADMASSAVDAVGGGRDHTNLMPFLCINFIIALFGVYPSRT